MKSAALILALASCIDSSGRVGEVAPDTTDTSETSQTPDTADAADTGEPCSGSGETRCRADGVAVEVCDGATWHATACGTNRLCVDAGGAQCLEASGSDACRQVVYCYLGCNVAAGAAASACELNCYLAGTVPAQGQLAAFVGCLDRAGCAQQGTADGVFGCIADACETPLAQCYFQTSGPGGCAAILGCRELCDKDDDACQLDCGSDATLAAQGHYAVLELCLFYACADSAGDDGCIDEAVGLSGACSPYVRACANPLND